MYTIKSLQKAILVLESFSPQQQELSGAQVAMNLGIHKTSAHRILATLSDGGLLERDALSGRYRVGPMLYMLGSLYLSTLDINRACEPVTEMLNALTSEAVHIGIRTADNLVYVHNKEARHEFRYAINIGTIRPAYAAAMGKALLSQLTENKIDELFPLENLKPITNKTVKTRSALKLDLEKIRETGVAYNKEETYLGIEGIACLIFDASGKAQAAMSITVPLFRMNEDYRQRLATLIKLGSDIISYRLGYQDPTHPAPNIEEVRFWWEQNQRDFNIQSESP